MPAATKEAYHGDVPVVDHSQLKQSHWRQNEQQQKMYLRIWKVNTSNMSISFKTFFFLNQKNIIRHAKIFTYTLYLKIQMFLYLF